MTNSLEICQWLIKRPRILTMAYQMYNMSDIPLESSLLSEPDKVTNPKIISEKEKLCSRLWEEEIKCLFLRCREPPDEAIEDLVKEIFNYDLFSTEAGEVISHSKRTLSDFRSKFNKKIEALVRDLKEIRSNEGLEIATITRSEVNEFISQKVIEDEILSRFLKSTNKRMLRSCGTMEKLVFFVRESFKVHYTAYNIKAIKKLDEITMGCEIPSRSGKNIASKLSL